jgi:hypothetical protein
MKVPRLGSDSLPRGHQMTRAEEYRHLAETVRVRARHERSPALRAEWEHLAETYSQLAEQTDPNEPLDPFGDPVFRILRGSRH